MSELNEKLLEEDPEFIPQPSNFNRKLLIAVGFVLILGLFGSLFVWTLSDQVDIPVQQPKKASDVRISSRISSAATIATIATSTPSITPNTPSSSTPTKDSRPKISHATLNELNIYESSKQYKWIKSKDYQDGTYISLEGDEFVLNDVEVDDPIVLCNKNEITNNQGVPLTFWDWHLSHDLTTLLVSRNHESGWRHSFFADYFVFNIKSKKTRALPLKPSEKQIPNVLGSGKIAFTLFSPVKSNIAWVRDNDLYLTVGEEEYQITNDGSQNIINGISDWVYEEEVLATKQATWFSTDGQALAYIKFNDTLVQEYQLQYYAKYGETAYPKLIDIKYPKPGTPNPIAEFFIAQKGQDGMISTKIDFGTHDFGTERVLTEVDWISPTKLFIRMMNRVQDVQRLFLVTFDGTHWTATLVRDEATPDQGWHNRLQPLYLIDQKSGSYHRYIEIMDNEHGYAHLAYFDSVGQSKPTHWITDGEWEIGEFFGFDATSDTVFFTSTFFGSSQRHVFSIKIDGTDMKLLSSPKFLDQKSFVPQLGIKPSSLLNHTGYFAADFSPGFTFFQLSYLGPDLPWQRLEKVGDVDFGFFLSQSEFQKGLYQQYETPMVQYRTIKNDNGDGIYV